MATTPGLFQTSGFNISRFKSEISKSGLLKNNLYLVEFSGKFGKIKGAQPSTGGQSKLIFYTSAVSLPSLQLATIPIRRYGYGPEEKVPYRPVFNDMRIDFFTEASNESSLVYALNYISDTVNFMNYDTFSIQPNNAYEVSYKDNIQFDLSIYVYNEKPDRILVYTFRDCFARELDGANLSWENQDQLLKTTVTFTFTDFYIQTYSSTTDSSGNLSFSLTQGLNFLKDGINSITSLQNLLNLGTAGQLVSAIRRPQSVNDAINLVNNAAVLATGLGL